MSVCCVSVVWLFFAVKGVCLNAGDRDAAFSIAPDGVLCQARLAQAWCGARASTGVIAGIMGGMDWLI